MSRRPVLIALVLSALFIVVERLPSLARPIWNVDEGFTAVIANVLRAGGTPYRDSIDHRGPVTYFVYALVFELAGKNNMVALHQALIGVIVALLGLVALLARRILSARGTAFTLIYFAVASTFAYPPFDLFAFHTEWLVILFTTLGTLLCWRALDRPRPMGLGILCGMCFALACFTKQPAGLDVLATLAFLGLLALVGPRAGAGASVRQILALVLGIALGGLLVAGIVCGFFVARGAWQDFVYYVWTYNRRVYMKAMPRTQTLANIDEAFKIAKNPMGLGMLAPAGGLLAFLRASGWAGERSGTTWRLFHVALWGISSLLAGLVGARPFGHYFILLLPAWCLLAGFAFDSLAAALWDAAPADLPGARNGRRALLISIAAASLLGLGFLVPEENAKVYRLMIKSWAQGEPGSRMAAYIRHECPPQERIVIWGFEPDLYVLSDRDPATRFSYTTFVVGLIPCVSPASREAALRWAVPGALETFLGELRANQPLFIVDASGRDHVGFELFRLDDFPPVAAILREFYEPVPELSAGAPGDLGYRVYKRRDRGPA